MSGEIDQKFDRFYEDYTKFRIQDAEWKGRVEERLGKALKQKVRTDWMTGIGAVLGGIFAGWFGGRASGG